ncbi:hypothetical protein TcWFU_001925 [Taenia crassiceps]|uniref:Uncharacterized protein n=1 Tax=Taenia crassiceps TaxID=6207 RepID=A0ABR4QCN5_9CEST
MAPLESRLLQGETSRVCKRSDVGMLPDRSCGTPHPRDCLEQHRNATCITRGSIAFAISLSALCEYLQARMFYQGDVMEYNPGSSMLTDAKACGLAEVESRNGFQRCRIDELASQINKQNRSKTFRRLHGPFGGLTALEALQLIKARGPNIIDRLPARKFKSAPTKATHDVSQATSMWFAVKRRQPVSRLPRYVVRSRGDPLIKVEANQRNADYKSGREIETTGVKPCKPTYRLIRRGKCIHGITIYPSLAMVIHPPQTTAPFESGDERCDLCSTVSKIAEMTQTSASDLTSSPLMRSISHLTPILGTYETPVQTGYKDLVPMNQQHQQEQQKQQLQQEYLKFVNSKDVTDKAICSPLADASNSTFDRGSVAAVQHHTRSDEAIPLSSLDAQGATETLQVTVPSCKTTSDGTPRQSAYKEPSDRRVHKKVRLAILVHPTATPTTCVGPKHDNAMPYHSSTTNSFRESLTNCSQSVTTFSSGSDNLMPDLDSCILDDQPTDISEVYAANGSGEGAFTKSFNNYQEGEVKTKQESKFEEENVQNTLTCITPPPCLSSISGCSSSTTSMGLLGREKGHKSESPLINENESSRMPVTVNSTFQPNATAVDRPLGDKRAHWSRRCSPTALKWAPKSVLMSKLSNISLARLSLEPPKPEVKVISPYTRTSCPEQINPLSEEVNSVKSCKRESNSLNATIEPFQTKFIVEMEVADSISALLEPTVRTLQDRDEVVVGVSYLPPSLHRIPRPLPADNHFWKRQKRAVMEESKFLKWVLKHANVSTTEMNTVVMHIAPNVLQCTKHRLPQITEVEDTTMYCTKKIHSELLHPYNIGTAGTSAP